MTNDSGMSRRAVLAGLGGAAVTGAAGVALAKPPAGHPRLTKALQEMREARHYLEVAPGNFGGHKMKAIEALTFAIQEIDLALDA